MARGNQLLKARIEKNITQKTAATLLGVKPAKVNYAESRNQKIPKAWVETIQNANVSPDKWVKKSAALRKGLLTSKKQKDKFPLLQNEWVETDPVAKVIEAIDVKLSALNLIKKELLGLKIL